MNVEELFQQVMNENCPDPLHRFAELVAADALAQTEQKPVAWMYVNEDGECEQIEYGVSTVEAPYITLLYTAPPSKPWVSLTDEQIAEVVGSPLDEVYLIDFRRVMKKLKEKNT